MSSPSAQAGPNQLAVDDALKQLFALREQVARRGAVDRILEDRRIAPLQLPGREEERPVDERYQVGQIDVHLPRAHECWRRRAGKLQPLPVRPRLLVGQRRPLRPTGVLIAQLGLQGAVLRREAIAPPIAEQAGHDIGDARCIRHVHGRPAELGRDLDRGVLLARRGAADEERKRYMAPFHLRRDEHHLVQ
jgi:hypothetical protein